jgi:aspartate aminotransferase-like enzyme
MSAHPLFEKHRIFAPGPTPVPEEVLAVLGRAPHHHRTPEFARILESVWKGLQFLYQTKEPVFVLSASGTGAMEAAVTNTLSPGDAVLVLNAGKFGERWSKLGAAYGLRVEEHRQPWGTALDPDAVKARLKSDATIRAVLFQACETSTSVLHPVEALARTVQENSNALVFVDAITALGVCPLPMDAWGLDAVVTGSQKALMLPPGISTLAFSSRATTATKSARLPRFYFDIEADRKWRSQGQTAWTPAVSLIAALDLVLKRFTEIGLDAVFEHHEALAEGTRQGLRALGLELFAKQSPSPSLTAWLLPQGSTQGERFIQCVRERFGVTLAEGQDAYKGKMIRLAHLGHFDTLDMIAALSAIEMGLNGIGIPVELGAGVAAAARYFSEKETVCLKVL